MDTQWKHTGETEVGTGCLCDFRQPRPGSARPLSPDGQGRRLGLGRRKKLCGERERQRDSKELRAHGDGERGLVSERALVDYSTGFRCFFARLKGSSGPPRSMSPGFLSAPRRLWTRDLNRVDVNGGEERRGTSSVLSTKC